VPLKNSTRTSSSHCLYPPNFLLYVSISVLMLRDCNLHSPFYFCSLLCRTKFHAVQVELLPYVAGYISEVILRLAYSYKASLPRLFKKLEEQRNNQMYNFLKQINKGTGIHEYNFIRRYIYIYIYGTNIPPVMIIIVNIYIVNSIYETQNLLSL